jgi:hypothetical protein
MDARRRFDFDAPSENDWSSFRVESGILVDGNFPGTVSLSDSRGLRVPAWTTVILYSTERRFLPVRFVKQSLRKRNEKL